MDKHTEAIDTLRREILQRELRLSYITGKDKELTLDQIKELEESINVLELDINT